MPSHALILLTWERIVHDHPDQKIEDLVELTAAELNCETRDVVETLMAEKRMGDLV